MILYLHGFRSSPLSMKSRLLAAQMQVLKERVLPGLKNAK